MSSNSVRPWRDPGRARDRHRAQRRPHAPTNGSSLVIVNTGDRPIQIGSHLHLPDVNTALDFDRAAAHGFRLDIPSGTSVRFEPGRRAARSPPWRCGAPAVPGHPDQADRREAGALDGCRSRARTYAALYGPTAGDQVRLGDTDLWIEVEQDLTVGGEEAVFGGGKSIRESMAQGTAHHGPTARWTPSSPTRSSSTTGASSAPTSASGTAGSSRSAARQPRHRRRRAPGAADRARHRRHLRRGQDPHRRRHRPPRPPPLAVADRRGAGHRADHARRRRHRAVRGHQGDDGHAGRLAPGEDPPRRSTPTRSTCCCSARATRSAPRRLRGAGAGRRRRLQGARGLGLHPGRDRRRPARRRRVGPAGRAALRLAQRGRLRRTRRIARHRRPVDPRVPRRGRRRRARAGHHDLAGLPERAARARPTRPCRTPSTPSPSTSTC